MGPNAIRLTAPCTLQHRALFVRLVAEACRLARIQAKVGDQAPGDDLTPGYDVRDPFDVAVVSAFAEIYNNIVRHAYRGVADPELALTATIVDSTVTLELIDQGKVFDPEQVGAPDLDALPEGGMGLHIARAMVDQVDYEPGPPNLWRLVKSFRTRDVAAPSARLAQR